jgi:hypothetical protein
MTNSDKIFVGFIDIGIAEKYQELKVGRPEDIRIYLLIDKASDILKIKPFHGIQVKREGIPKKYFKEFGIDNLWKYDLSDDWRMIYTITGDENIITVQIIEWFDHKDYDRRFGYN